MLAAVYCPVRDRLPPKGLHMSPTYMLRATLILTTSCCGYEYKNKTYVKLGFHAIIFCKSTLNLASL